MTNKQDVKSQRIAALEQLIMVLRKQATGMRISLAAKDDTIENLQRQLSTLQSTAPSSVPIHR